MIELSIDINLKNQRNQTILHISLEKGLCDIVKLLLNSGKIEFCHGLILLII